jgi:4'-phosphopantetheinyl transferase EntD
LSPFFPFGPDLAFNRAAAAAVWPSPPFRHALCERSTRLGSLHPAEAELMAGAGPGRVWDFRAGRHCARQVLAALGHAGIPVLMDAHGAPRWPRDVVGSISHSGGKAIAVATRDPAIRAVGADIQMLAWPFPREALPFLFRPEEIRVILGAGPRHADHHAYAVFSAKESVMKCCCAAFGCLPEMTAVLIEMDLAEGIFRARTPGWPACGDFHGSGVAGRVGFDGSHVLTGIWLRQAPRPGRMLRSIQHQRSEL